MLIRTLLSTIIAVFLFACGNEGSMAKYDSSAPSSISVESSAGDEMDDYASMEEFEMEPPRTAEPPPPPAPDGQPQVRQQKVIYTASARAQVENLDTALARVTRLISQNGGFLSSQHRSNSTYEHAAQLTIRLPAGKLEGTLAFLPQISNQIDYQNLDSRDVTAQWLDLETRLQTKRDVRDRYIDILRNRAQKVEDILNAEDKIRVITEEIESKEGQLRYLRDQVSLSTLTLELYETVEYRNTGETYTRSFGSKLVASLAYGWELVQDLILGTLAIWPLLILGFLGVWLFRRWRGKRAGK
ncbi:DUF4349 domain-containing protein [Neolewinella persica]|uniref:DUF4349 domain-containing protein n=1 Tax=Neolewinella persica TaxID=70998 RepID=UPI000369DA3E|nr:DUF4349 domain-containing protein [Neolewinella persica]